jgi:hypothetical protein
MVAPTIHNQVRGERTTRSRELAQSVTRAEDRAKLDKMVQASAKGGTGTTRSANETSSLAHHAGSVHEAGVKAWISPRRSHSSSRGIHCMTKQTKQASRDETERLVKEALERGSVAVTKVAGRRDEKCGKCGAPNRVKIPVGQSRVDYSCKWCGHQQQTM